MEESPSEPSQSRIYTAPRTDISQDQGKFRIHFNFPGRAVPRHEDHGYGPLATVVESFMEPGTLIRMHQHRNEEIIPWVPEGVMRHDDRQGNELVTDPNHLMVMNAGSGFWHAEETLADDPTLRMLQISFGHTASILSPISNTSQSPTLSPASGDTCSALRELRPRCPFGMMSISMTVASLPGPPPRSRR